MCYLNLRAYVRVLTSGLAVLLFFAMCCWRANADVSSKSADVIDKIPIHKGQVDWTIGEVSAKGFGAPPKGVKGAQARIMAREAAIVVAQRNLTGIVYGIRITSDTTVKDAVVQSDEIRRRVEGVIKGAELVDEKSLEDGGYEVTMVMHMYGRSDSLADSIKFGEPLPTKVDDKANPTIVEPPVVTVPPTPTTPVPEATVPTTPATSETPEIVTSTGPYTGLLVDCRGIKISRAMGPRIYDESGGDVWGLIHMDPDLAQEKGKVGYCKSVAQAKSMRVGANPLIVKATASRGNKFYPSDAVVNIADGALVKSENTKYHFLENLAVGFLVD